jgi:hypothetical protein
MMSYAPGELYRGLQTEAVQPTDRGSTAYRWRQYDLTNSRNMHAKQCTYWIYPLAQNHQVQHLTYLFRRTCLPLMAHGWLEVAILQKQALSLSTVLLTSVNWTGSILFDKLQRCPLVRVCATSRGRATDQILTCQTSRALCHVTDCVHPFGSFQVRVGQKGHIPASHKPRSKCPTGSSFRPPAT